MCSVLLAVNKRGDRTESSHIHTPLSSFLFYFGHTRYTVDSSLITVKTVVLSENEGIFGNNKIPSWNGCLRNMRQMPSPVMFL